MKILRILKIALIVFTVVFAFLSIIPYLVYLPHAKVINEKPFENSSFAIIDNIRIHYRVWLPSEVKTNQKTDKKILLVHGMAGSTFSFRNNVEALVKSGYKVVAVDLPGFGYSDRSGGINHSQKNRADLLWRLLGEIDGGSIKGKWTLLGHSMGAGAITEMAFMKEENVESLIYVDGAVLTGGGNSNFALKYPPVQRWAEVIGRYFLLNEKTINNLLISAYARPVTSAEVEGYLTPLKIAGTEGAFIDMTLTSDTIDIEKLRGISVPVIGIWGEKDTWVPKSDGEELKKIIPNFELHIIKGAGHCPMETHAAEFNEL